MNTLDMPNTPLLDPAALAQLQRRMHGELLTPDQEAYAVALRAHTERYNPRPALIARCLTVHDVVLAIIFARERKLALATRAGDQCEGAILLDLSPMRQIVIDPLQRIARVQPGASPAEFARATAAYGLAGGTVLALEIATVEGVIVTASAHQHPELFQAVFAGGNTGVVTATTCQLRPLDADQSLT